MLPVLADGDEAGKSSFRYKRGDGVVRNVHAIIPY